MRWTFKPQPDPLLVEALQESLQIDTLTATLLVQRGITTFDQARQFFRPSVADLHDPFLMKDMDLAVNRIETALAKEENILVFGDYDVDGTTAVSLVSAYLKTRTNQVATYIPDRYIEGYGVSFQGIDFAADNEFSLIIALDCGIKSVQHVQYAQERGIDFIICDHHRPGETLPQAVAVLDPKRDDCFYPYDELCGCGIGFKLIQALAQNQNQAVEELLPYLDLVATAIAADIVPMTGENRALAYLGLQIINSNPRPGIRALLQQVKNKTRTISDVVFTLAPRINAAGRIKHGNYAVALLSEFDSNQAQQFAAEIEQFNADRKELDKAITQEALAQIVQNQEENNATTVVFQADWHKGVIGIVASRLIETYHRPTLVFTQSGDYYAASARSVSGFDVYAALEACAEHLVQFGGHKYAAGLSLKPENYAAFKQAFENVVQTTLPTEMETPEIAIDASLQLEQITPKLMRILKQFEPFGPLNLAPVFHTAQLRDTGYAKPIGADQTHLKLQVVQGNSERFGAIGFGLADKLSLVNQRQSFEAVYCLEENEWNNTESIQLRIKDIQA
ncbi:MAG: single-stranded-DNA-specific exonuclease RecJ [Flavobacterium sp.]|nr:single-stranded-DNA-specific exonuclease RecJ [Flavobacterium sp.]